ncbi:MAG: family 10 glycosylhydrolase [Calditrichia bacterium]|jgi:uncharacterized lipoprotein YddW (UPF0748 family)|nr:family 10 glycosylhydrolase [Calditrichia bacterium]
MRLFLVVLLYLIPHLLIGNTVHGERSALWVVRYAVTTKSDVDRILSTAIELNISDIFFQIRALGHTYYNSQWEPKAASVEDDFDPLEYVIKKSDHSGMRIHAWVNMFYVWAGDQFPENKSHILNKHSDYVLRDGDFPDYKSLKRQGHEGFFLDPKVAAVQDDLLNILREISEYYDLDGIHLDYYRYPSLAYSFTPASRTMYMMEDIYDPWIIYQSAQTYTEQRGYEVFLYADREYRKSLTGTLSNYLEVISKTIKNIQPDLELSVAVKPDPVIAKHRYFQDWLSWLRNDICDFVAIMNYRTDWQEFNSVLKQLNDRNLKEKIIVGISTYNQDVGAVLKRLKATRDGGFAGFSLFSYNYLHENKEYLMNLQRQIIARR